MVERLAGRENWQVRAGGNVSSRISLQDTIPQVDSKSSVVVIDVTDELAERHVLWARAPPCRALAEGVRVAGRPNAMLIARDAVVEEMVGHSDHVDADRGVADSSAARGAV